MLSSLVTVSRGRSSESNPNMKNFLSYLLVAAPVLAQVSPTINDFPSREFGQTQLAFQPTSYSPNLVEGRELSNPGSIAFDTSVSPPIVYVADTFNNRILAWKSPDNLGACGTQTNTVRVGSSGGCGYADLVIGQRDPYSTFAQGPGSSLSVGLFVPSAVAVDSSGNLYVADAGNNRIVRYPKPFQQSGSLQTVDLVIGQNSVSSGTSPNQGNQLPTASSLYLSGGSAGHNGRSGPASIAFDAAGNLWVPDTGNNRALRFPAAKLAAGTQLPTADLVLGQFDFTSRDVLQQPGGGNPQTYAQSLAAPTAVAIDASGRVYVSDSFARVLFYSANLQNGLPAQRILGINTQVTQQGQVAPPYPNQYTLGVPSGGQLIPQQGIWVVGNNLFVADTPANRVVRYDAPENWPPATNQNPSPPSIQVVGQADQNSGKVNRDQASPDATTLGAPVMGASFGDELWVVDGGNNRVLGYPPQGLGNYTFATRLIGQLDYKYNAANLIEGREGFFSYAFLGITGATSMVVDNSSNPPHLYVSDPSNNRILGFRDARNISQNSVADLVIGQPDVYSSVANYPSGKSDQPNNTGLLAPVGITVDGSGNVYVADSANGRVLRFPSPFSQPAGQLQTSDLVIGQTSFNLKIQNPSQQNMGTPSGVAYLSDSGGAALYVSDNAFNRVLIFKRSAGNDFNNGQLASVVLGQPNFTSVTASNAQNLAGMNRPNNVAVDSSGRLYVTDPGNSRVVVFTDARNQSNGASSVLQLNGLNQPQGIAVSQITGEIWVANTGSHQIYRFPEFQALQSSVNPQPTAQLGPPNAFVPYLPLALALDSADNLIVVDGTNRVTFYFAKLTSQNAANFSERPVAPGMLLTLYRVGKSFNLPTNTAQSLPWPLQMSDLQVLVAQTGTSNFAPAPIYATFSIGMNVMVPTTLGTSGSADFLIVKVSTGEVIGAVTFALASANPGFLSADGSGHGQVIANNGDGTRNSPSTPAKVNDVMTFCLTGQGLVPGRPDDGQPPPTALPLPVPTVMFIGAAQAEVLYSGLGCGYPGVWQINARVPANTVPSNTVPVVLTVYDIQSNIGDVVQNGQVIVNARITNTIAVK